VNKNGYIGEAVRNEIEYAKRQNKEIIYLEYHNEKDNTKTS
jgi:anti-sigma regulatory factor (Ser/Thr protein kinase)